MSVHTEIKSRREALGWSHQRLADEISRLEGLAKPLAWQTVQQWENGTSAPKRSRLSYVAQALGTTEAVLLGLSAESHVEERLSRLEELTSLSPRAVLLGARLDQVPAHLREKVYIKAADFIEDLMQKMGSSGGGTNAPSVAAPTPGPEQGPKTHV